VLKTIQLMRGCAAIAVVALHVDVICSQKRYGSNDSFYEFGAMGWLGVNFFFVLSGFIILNAHYNDIGKPNKIGRYLYQRVTRLYPIYWVVLSFFILASSYLTFEKSWTFGDFFVAYTLLPLSEYPNLPVKVAWTLLFEIKFYLIFGLLIVSKRIGYIFFFFWFSILITTNFSKPISEWSAHGLADIFNIWNINFAIGMLVFWVARKTHCRFGWIIFLVGVTMLWCLSIAPTSMSNGLLSFSFMMFSAIAFGMIIAGAVLIEKSSINFRTPKFLLVLGDASYSIYLVHSAIISAGAIVANKFSLNNGITAPALIFTASIAIGVAAHFYVELPMLKFLRKKNTNSI
jgi:exopolysaccharide production protein ExoZ